MKLPNEFVAFVDGSRVFKFTKDSSDSYSKHVWNKEWVFDDSVDEKTARYYYETLQTYITKEEPLVDQVLAYESIGWDLPKCTVGEYLIELGQRVWEEGEGFSGKRPFGNSGWQTDVMYVLADGGFIGGTRNSEGDWEDLDEVRGNEIILACFKRLKEKANQ